MSTSDNASSGEAGAVVAETAQVRSILLVHDAQGESDVDLIQVTGDHDAEIIKEGGTSSSYKFDGIAVDKASLAEHTDSLRLEQLMEGGNVSVLAMVAAEQAPDYLRASGQEAGEEPTIVDEVVSALFATLSSADRMANRFAMKASYLMVHEDTVYDLLQGAEKLPMRRDRRGFVETNLKWQIIRGQLALRRLTRTAHQCLKQWRDDHPGPVHTVLGIEVQRIGVAAVHMGSLELSVVEVNSHKDAVSELEAMEGVYDALLKGQQASYINSTLCMCNAEALGGPAFTCFVPVLPRRDTSLADTNDKLCALVNSAKIVGNKITRTVMKKTTAHNMLANLVLDEDEERKIEQEIAYKKALKKSGSSSSSGSSDDEGDDEGDDDDDEDDDDGNGAEASGAGSSSGSTSGSSGKAKQLTVKVGKSSGESSKSKGKGKEKKASKKSPKKGKEKTKDKGKKEKGKKDKGKAKKDKSAKKDKGKSKKKSKK